jgi:hypothetical protein
MLRSRERLKSLGHAAIHSIQRPSRPAPRGLSLILALEVSIEHAGHHRLLVDIQTGAMRMQNFHRPSSSAVGLEPPLMKSRIRAPGCRQPVAQSGSALGIPGPTNSRARSHQDKATSVPTTRHEPIPGSHQFHLLRVGNTDGRLIREMSLANPLWGAPR